MSPERHSGDSVRLDSTRTSGSSLPISREDVLSDADWPYLDEAEREVHVPRKRYALLFLVLTALFSIGSVTILDRHQSAFVQFERMYDPPALPFSAPEHIEGRERELADELGVSMAQLYEAELVLNKFLQERSHQRLGPLDWSLRIPAGRYTVQISYGIFINMALAAVISMLLYIRARDRASTRIIDAQNRRQRELNEVLERKIDEARQYMEELGQAQHRLVQAEKLASIGRMSATLAHEIRNPMSIIQSAAGMAAEDLPKESAPGQAIGLIRAEVERLDHIITELLNFARPKPPHMERHELPQLIEGWTAPLKEELLRDGVVIETDLDPEMPVIKADADQLYQVVLNVIWNARDAMKGSGGGTIEIVSEPAGDRRVALLIRDDGPGMDEETLEQIYEPFFTTKTHGSGLGLPVVQQLMEGMGGLAAIESQRGIGTTVRLEMRTSRLSRRALRQHRQRSRESIRDSDDGRIFEVFDTEETDPAFTSGAAEAAADERTKEAVTPRA